MYCALDQCIYTVYQYIRWNCIKRYISRYWVYYKETLCATSSDLRVNYAIFELGMIANISIRRTEVTKFRNLMWRTYHLMNWWNGFMDGDQYYACRSTTDVTRIIFYKHRLTLITAWKLNRMFSKVWDEITYPFSNFDGGTVDVWTWISNFIAHFMMNVTTYPR